MCTNLRLATRRLTAVYDAALAPLGINIGQYFLLRILRGRPQVSLTEIGVLAELERSTVGRNIRVLERMGLVAATRGDKDAREAQVSLTAAGRATLQDAEPRWEQAQRDTTLRLGEDKLAGLQAALEMV